MHDQAPIALAIVAHACISRLARPEPVVNLVAWVMTVLLILAIVFGSVLPVLR